MVIPYQQLSQRALLGVLDDYILREGTDYGDEPLALSERRARLMAQLRAGRAEILFDAETESTTLRLRDS